MRPLRDFGSLFQRDLQVTNGRHPENPDAAPPTETVSGPDAWAAGGTAAALARQFGAGRPQ